MYGSSNPCKLKIAIVCSSNQNRSMEAHSFLNKRGYDVKSFGTGSHVKLPGPAAHQPNIYSFSTSYEAMYSDLSAKDRDLYTQNGILHMLDRNRRIKERPQRFQDYDGRFDLIITVEERCYDAAVEYLENRGNKDGIHPVHIVNIDIKDNHEEATIGAFLIYDLVSLIGECDDLDCDIDLVAQEFSAHCKRPILHTVSFY